MISRFSLTARLKSILSEQFIIFIANISQTTIELIHGVVHISGANRYLVEKLLIKIDEEVSHNRISVDEIKALYISMRNQGRHAQLKGLGKELIAKSDGQSLYIDLINSRDIIFASGVAGTGKTHIAAALGLNALFTRQVDRLILSRPVVEAGEKLGFLPGDLKDKIDPFLRPLYDELLLWIDRITLEKYISQGKIELVPIAYMRGRTLKNAWIILDEGQNTSINQMKMFLTRFGYGSKMIITGDQSQIDLNKNIKSGFIDAINRLSNIPEVGVVHFHNESVIRHPILKQLIKAYSDES